MPHKDKDFSVSGMIGKKLIGEYIGLIVGRILTQVVLFKQSRGKL